MINPWHFNYSQVAELSEENQQKLIKAHPKNIRKKLKKYLTILRNDVILIIEREVRKMSKCYRVRVIVDTYYDVKADSEEMAIDKAYNYMVDGYEPQFETEEIDEEDYEGA